MRHPTLVLLLVLLPPAILLTAGGDATGGSHAAPLTEAARGRLMGYVASEDTDAFLADPLVMPHVERLLGNELSHLRQNIDVRGSVAFSSGMLYVVGNAPHQGLEEHGFVGIETFSGRVCAGVFSKGRFEVYGAGSDRDTIPVALREWILATWAYASLEGSIPANARLVQETGKK